jgi:hypothetical protein
MFERMIELFLGADNEDEDEGAFLGGSCGFGSPESWLCIDILESKQNCPASR